MKKGLLGQHNQFLFVWVGQTASIFGDRVTGIALPWLLLQQTHSAFDAGVVTAVRYLPLIAFGIIAGLIVDRLNRRFVLIICDIGRAGILGLAAFMNLLLLPLPLWFLVCIVFMLGTGQLFFQTAYRAWLPDITEEKALSNANAALEASDAASTLAGPVLGGVIIQALGAVLSLGVDAISYIISALTLAFLRDKVQPVEVTNQSPQHTSLSTLWKEALEGVRFILSSPEQRLLKAIGAVLFMSSGSIELLLAVLAQIRLHLPPWQAGCVFGAAGIGGLIGSALAPSLYKRGWRQSIMGALCLGTIASLGLAYAGQLPATAGFVLAMLSNLVLDGACSFGFILTTTENTLITPREVRGRVNAASNMYSSTIRGGSVLLMGIIVASGGTLIAFALLACCFTGAALLAREPKLV